MTEISTIVDGEKYVLVPEREDRTCAKCALVGKLGACQLKNYEFVNFDGTMICRALNGVWKKAD